MNTYIEIKKDLQIKKFCLYGFFKDLKFFEPYLLIYLTSLGFTFLEIGSLYALREIIIYLFEIPSGIFADTYGKKLELMICFVFYMLSFVFFFIGKNITIIGIGMVLFGFGEAFRSGTHKAMIFSYLEQKDWFKHKTYVYGRTRSFSLLGGALSSVLSIGFYLYTGNIRMLFLISIIPYILDFILIWSYPDTLNEKHHSNFTFKFFLSENIRQMKAFIHSKKLVLLTLNSSTLDAVFKSVGDYIQPILQLLIASSLVTNFSFLGGRLSDPSNRLILYLGVAYGVIGLMSAIGSKNVYKLLDKKSKEQWLDQFYIIMALLFAGIAFGIYFNLQLFIILVFILANVLIDSRRPIFVDLIGDHLEKDQRATVLSIESQLKSFAVMLIAPLTGFIADLYGFAAVFFFLFILTLVLGRVTSIQNLFAKERRAI